MKTTFSSIAAKLLQQRDPRIGLVGFAAAMRSLVSELEGDVEYVDEIWPYNRPRFIPDAFYLDRKKQQVVVYEIEDTHFLSLTKLQRMTIFYFWLEYHYWTMRVLIANRYGHVTGEIDLMRHFYAAESPTKKSVRSDVLSKRQLRALQQLHPLEHERFIKKCLRENQEKANPEGHGQFRAASL